MKDFERRLDESLQRLAELIDRVAESGDPSDIRKAVTASSQLARIVERVAQARREQEPDSSQQDTRAASQEQLMESLRALLKQYSQELGV